MIARVLNALSTEQTLALIARVDLSDALLVIKLNHDALSQALGIALDHLDHD
jgi:hypothetical protein